jgi:hypothetical protein
VNGDLVQGVEPSLPPRNRGRRRSRGRNRRRGDRTDVWRLPPRSDSQVRMGATAVHEGKAHALLAARRAPVPRRGESLTDAKWPLSMKRRSGLTKPLSVTRRWGKRPRQLSPGRAHAKAWTPPPENRSGRRDRSVKGRPHRPRGEEHAQHGHGNPERGGCGSPKRRNGSRDGPPSPAMRRVPKPVVSTRRASAEDAPGASEYGYT